MNMECANVKCSKPDSDRMISCWLCLKYYHLKCSGSNLRARDADALADSQKFLNWTCVCCRNVGVEFYSLFKNSRDEFEKINQDFLSLQSKMAKFGELFSKYNDLDKFMNSLHNLSPKNKKNVGSVATQCALPLASCSKIVSEMDAITSVATPNSSKSLMSTGSGGSDLLIEYSDRPPLLSTSCPARSDKGETTNYSNLLPVHNVINDNHTSISVPHITGLDNNEQTPHIRNNPKPLRAIPANKTIFVSRLATDTTVEDVEFYIKSKCDANLLSSVYKFVYSEPRIVSSFKITIPDELFKLVVSPGFWPTGTIVREFVFKERQRQSVRLPVTASNISKN